MLYTTYGGDTTGATGIGSTCTGAIGTGATLATGTTGAIGFTGADTTGNSTTGSVSVLGPRLASFMQCDSMSEASAPDLHGETGSVSGE